MATKAKSPPVGVDFGTTYSRVSLFRNGKAEIIPSRYGNLSTPNYVTFTEAGCLVGDEAKAKISSPARNLVNTVFDVKRFMGVPFYSAHEDSKYYPFEVISDAEGRTKFSVENITFYPEEIFTKILSELKKDAEAYVGVPVTDAVITVSPAFNSSQRNQIKKAASTAGWNVVRLIDDTTTAAITYTLLSNGDEEIPKDERNVLLFDLGGGNLSVTIATIEDGIIEVKSIAGNPHLGGVDFDNRILTHFIKEFKEKHDRDVSLNKRVIFRLRTGCQKAKQILSSATRASIQIDGLFDSIDFRSSITRTLFEELNKDLFKEILKTVEKALRDARIDKTNIQDIVMLGGSTHIPKIQDLLKSFFNGKELNFSVDPEEAVVRGAAVQAAILTGSTDESLQELLLLEVTPASLGIENVDGEMQCIIKRNTTIPIKQMMTFTTCADFQRAAMIKVYEGECKMAKDNHFLGELMLRGIQESESKNQQIQVVIDVDADGIVAVTAVEKLTGNENEIVLGLNTNETRAYNEKKDRIAAKRRLERYTSDVQGVLDELRKVKSWLSNNQNAKKEEYENKKKYLEEVCYPFITKLQEAASNGTERDQPIPKRSRRSSMNGASEQENDMRPTLLGVRYLKISEHKKN